MENTTLIQHRNTDLNPTRYNPAQLHWICIGFALCEVAIKNRPIPNIDPTSDACWDV